MERDPSNKEQDLAEDIDSLDNDIHNFVDDFNDLQAAFDQYQQVDEYQGLHLEDMKRLAGSLAQKALDLIELVNPIEEAVVALDGGEGEEAPEES